MSLNRKYRSTKPTQMDLATPRAGKEGGPFESWWRIKDQKTKHICTKDLKSVQCAGRKKTKQEKEKKEESVSVGETDENTYMVIIPRYLHGEQQCIDAKMEELNRFLQL